jgi:HNH endonuclease
LGFLPRLFGVVVTGLLLYVFFLWLGVGAETAGVVVLVLLAGAALAPYRKKRSVCLAPTHSGSIPQWVKIAVATRDGGKCRRCGSAHDLQYDHIILYSRGGRSDDVNNIQLLCGRCDRLKSNRYVR